MTRLAVGLLTFSVVLQPTRIHFTIGNQTNLTTLPIDLLSIQFRQTCVRSTTYDFIILERCFSLTLTSSTISYS